MKGGDKKACYINEVIHAVVVCVGQWISRYIHTYKVVSVSKNHAFSLRGENIQTESIDKASKQRKYFRDAKQRL